MDVLNPDVSAIRGMFLAADRVRMMAGDLTGPNSLPSIDAAARRWACQVRARLLQQRPEDALSYGNWFVANVEALAGDEQSLVLPFPLQQRPEPAPTMAVTRPTRSGTQPPDAPRRASLPGMTSMRAISRIMLASSCGWSANGGTLGLSLLARLPAGKNTRAGDLLAVLGID